MTELSECVQTPSAARVQRLSLKGIEAGLGHRLSGRSSAFRMASVTAWELRTEAIDDGPGPGTEVVVVGPLSVVLVVEGAVVVVLELVVVDEGAVVVVLELVVVDEGRVVVVVVVVGSDGGGGSEGNVMSPKSGNSS